MSEGLPDRAAELIPELREWNSGGGVSLSYWAYAVGRYDYAIAFASVFWPEFVVYDDCVFRQSAPGADTYATALSSLEGDRSKVEAMMNHLYIADVFESKEFEPTSAVMTHIARLLKDMWSCKLQRDFPERHFQVEVYDATPEDLDSYDITFFQKRLEAE